MSYWDHNDLGMYGTSSMHACRGPRSAPYHINTSAGLWWYMAHAARGTCAQAVAEQSWEQRAEGGGAAAQDGCARAPGRAVAQAAARGLMLTGGDAGVEVSPTAHARSRVQGEAEMLRANVMLAANFC